MASHGVPRPSTREQRTELAQQKEQVKIKEYRELVSIIQEKIAAKDHTRTTLLLTSRLLNQNPDSYTHWNFRRQVLLSLLARPDQDSPYVVELLQQDLYFLLPLLQSHPKSYALWTHRLWVLFRLPVEEGHSLQAYKQELGLCTKVLTRDRRNFHGWMYRRIVVGEIERLSGETMAESEFLYTTKMIELDLSNFSAWHYRATLLPRLLAHRNADHAARLRMLDGELEVITRALFTDPSDSSVWFYHNFLLLTTCSAKSLPAVTKSPTPAADTTIPCTATDVTHSTPLVELSKEEKARYLTQEIGSIRSLLEEEDSKWIIEALVVYTGMLDRLSGGETIKVGEGERQRWLKRLEELDPLRKGRWRDWTQGVGVIW